MQDYVHVTELLEAFPKYRMYNAKIMFTYNYYLDVIAICAAYISHPSN